MCSWAYTASPDVIVEDGMVEGESLDNVGVEDDVYDVVIMIILEKQIDLSQDPTHTLWREGISVTHNLLTPGPKRRGKRKHQENTGS